MNMGDALRKQFAGLDGRDDPMFRNAAKTVSCRFSVWFFPHDFYLPELMSIQVSWVLEPLSSGDHHQPIRVVAC